MTQKFYDVTTETNVLRALLSNKGFCSSVMTYNKITDEHFVDVFCKDTWQVIKAFYHQYGKAPKQQMLIKYISKYITYYPDNFKSKENQLKIWRASAKKLYKTIIVNSKSEYDALEDYRKLRLTQKVVLDITRNLRYENIDEVKSTITRAVSKFDIVENVITQGNIVDDLEEHYELDKQIKSGELKCIKTNIVGVIEKHDKPRIIKLDDKLWGGLYAKEVLMYIGELSIGKSFVLMDNIYNAAKFEKKNCILFTVEMDKIKSQRRIYTRAVKIPYYVFKRGELTKQNKQILNQWRERWKEDKCGILEVVAFEKGATVIDIANKVNEVENKYGEPFEMIAVDYLQDLNSTGRYRDSKDWETIGEISWELVQLSKYHDNHRGLIVVTASQKKTKFFRKGETVIGSSMGSALPEHHATVTIGMGQTKEDILMKRIRWDLTKNRDGERDVTFYTFPDFAMSKISSIKKMKEYYGD